MKRNNYKIILIFIGIVITLTIALQVYWNIKKYHTNKEYLITEVHKTFESSIEKYFANDLKNNVSISSLSSTILKTEDNNKDFKDLDKQEKKITISSQNTDLKNFFDSIKKSTPKKNNSTNTILINQSNATDYGINFDQISMLAKKIAISLTKDSIRLLKLNSIIKEELTRKKIDIPFTITEFNKKNGSKRCYPKTNIEELNYNYISNSNYLPKNAKIEIAFYYPFFLILKRGLFEIVLSFILSISVIFCLFYLLKTINKQKKADEIKNDLISNITHEFKTPITTINAAIEGIKHFNSINDTDKTNRYLQISTSQLHKLENMVEKLLETATLHTDEIVLNYELINITQLITTVVESKLINTSEKEISFKPEEDIFAKVDPFHFENCIINLIDNAVKYGGNKIEISISSNNITIEVIVKDNGQKIPKEHREKIFEKFYRIPKGNIHDIKGFGIGLYYCRQIIKKHNGNIILKTKEGTSFILNLPKNE
ncbi:MAG: HAMP domain-containing sensor histidine kinase [Limnohabitans sp.]|nr:HAMP domain-containing sensor histidine kinase [Limnohabitans sp.]